MPEGDTIFRTATRLRAVLEGNQVRAATCREARIDASALVGHQVTATEARGKHMLLHFDNGQVLHSHMGMTGSWHVYPPQQPWRKPGRQAALMLDVGQHVCVCFRPKLVELLTAQGLKRHPYLSRLGPDLLSDHFSLADAVARCRVHDRQSIGATIMNQTVVCGIGNVYKSEVLFLTRINPFAAGNTLDDEQLRNVLTCARGLMMSNRAGYPRRTRFGRDGQKLWVYGRLGEPCLECGSSILMRRQGDLGRSTYWCPVCQT